MNAAQCARKSARMFMLHAWCHHASHTDAGRSGVACRDATQRRPLRQRAVPICAAACMRAPTSVAVVHQADALDGPVLLKLVPQLALRDLVAEARHKQGLVWVALQHTRTGMPRIAACCARVCCVHCKTGCSRCRRGRHPHATNVLAVLLPHAWLRCCWMHGHARRTPPPWGHCWGRTWLPSPRPQSWPVWRQQGRQGRHACVSRQAGAPIAYSAATHARRRRERACAARPVAGGR